VELLSVLDDLEEFVQSSPRVPLTKKVLVDEEKFLDLLDRARTILPEEVRKAKWLVQEREKVINESRQEANRLLEEAQKEIEKKVEESEIVRRAREVAEEIVSKAEQVAREMRLGARDYSDDVLAKLETRLEKILKEIEGGRKELKNMK
jgi:vacuolar-type H+-ATPase subunit H